ncbi:hypothetical protein G8S49_12715 [Clostridium botulinum C]|uniref:Uncharacterized protein n=3 Tax=Clostridium botulinum TaxID=1491 RepID=A0A9Q4TH16_CLOBO|nr:MULTISPECIES: hypothetical protein [Clostridium]AYF53975.1 hypothetical protein DFH04_04145 [Clostridium novyi]EES90520.1 conserved hypothetical protein [Clostridium botulinum D str. 1873]KEI07607.1 hypothetical protein Z957_08385 [Clostridium sp. K25]MBO3442425.1 hypothetical protein [Clostridium haemolyticum]MCD3196118.1 hypothetical protein [Clostridium botulinum C]
MNKGLNKIIGIFLVVFLIANVITVIRFNNITEDINRNFNKLNYLEKNIDELSENINKINSRQDWITSKDYKVLELDKDYKNITIMIYGNLKELENNSKMYLLYGKVGKTSSDEIEWNKVSLSVSYGLKFSKTLKLPYNEDYRFKVLAESPTKSRSEELLYVYFKNEIKNRISTHIFENTNANDKDYTRLDVNIDNNYKSQKKFKVKNILINVYKNNKIEDNIKIYEDGKSVKNSDIKEIPNYDKNNNLIDNDDGKIEKLNYNVKIKNDDKEVPKKKFEIVIEDYMGQKFIEEYPKVK